MQTDFRPAIRRALNSQPSIRWLGRLLNVPKKAALVVTTENLAMLSWQAGHHGVPALAKKIGRHEKTLWCAVRWPDRYGPTYKLITEALNAN